MFNGFFWVATERAGWAPIVQGNVLRPHKENGAFVCGCACLDPFFASLSALSFTGVSECPGIHCMKTITPQAVKSSCVL